jgi:DNA polymerase
VSYAVDDGEVKLLSDLPTNPDNELLRLAKNPDAIFTAFNAFFERVIWKNILTKNMGYPPIPVTRWRCVQAKACAYGLPKSLKKAAKAMNLADQKDDGGYQIMRLMSRPIKQDERGTIYNEKEENYQKLYEYCKQDVRTERELDTRLPDLQAKEQEIWFYDQLINERGTRVDIDSVKDIIHLLESQTYTLNKDLVKLINGKVMKGYQVARRISYLHETGCDIPDLQKATVTEYLKSGKLNKNQIKVLRLRQQLGRTSTKKYHALLQATDHENILRDNYVYHAANPGRWGGKLVQLQNLTYDKTGQIDPERVFSLLRTHRVAMLEMSYPGRILDVVSKCIRGVFVPSPGKELYVVDYGAIEARVLMWLAQERVGLAEFRATDEGTDEYIYVKMAQRIYRNNELTKKDNPQERALGKAAILGAGYGMGGKKFAHTCQSYGIPIEEDEGQKVINLYRRTYREVREFWYKLEHAMTCAFNTPGKTFSAGPTQWIRKKDIYCKLPSGRILTYIDPDMVENRFGGMSISYMTEVNKQWVRKETFGGSLTENVTQATARDIMAYSFPRLEKAGFPVLMHTHDEIVSERPLGENRVDEMIRIMCQGEDWSKGCPIVAEGFTCNRYKKG